MAGLVRCLGFASRPVFPSAESFAGSRAPHAKRPTYIIYRLGGKILSSTGVVYRSFKIVLVIRRDPCPQIRRRQ
jgi:hypothetical protein